MFQPGEFVTLLSHVRAIRSDGLRRMEAEDVLVVIDPAWVGLQPVEDLTYCIYAIPFYERATMNEVAGEQVTPYVGGILDPERSVPKEEWTNEEREAIAQGTILQNAERFRYGLMAVWPRVFTYPTASLSSGFYSSVVSAFVGTYAA